MDKEGRQTSLGAYSRYVSPITEPIPFPRAAEQVMKPALQMWEQRPSSPITRQLVNNPLSQQSR